MSRRFDAAWTRLDTPTPPANGGGADVAGPPPANGAAETVGLECPSCGCHHFETVETRPRPGMILRRRACRHCGRRVTTREKALASA